MGAISPLKFPKLASPQMHLFAITLGRLRRDSGPLWTSKEEEREGPKGGFCSSPNFEKMAEIILEISLSIPAISSGIVGSLFSLTYVLL